MPPKVLLILGKGRSGTTLLDELLGQVDGFFSTGELSRLWRWGLVGGYPCACGEPVPDCPLWSAVLTEADLDRRDWDEDANLVDWVLSWSRVPLILGRPRYAGSTSERIRRFTRLMSQLYTAISVVTGARVIVDSTKWPAHPALVGLVPGVRPYGLHVTRDPRAVAFSYLRTKETDPSHPSMPRFHPLHSAVSWLARNAVVELATARTRAGAVERLRYEDFVANPEDRFAYIVRHVGESIQNTGPFIDPRRAQITGTHLVGGNPRRFEQGVIEIRADDEWAGNMRPWHAALVTAATYPLLSRYRYPVLLGGRRSR